MGAYENRAWLELYPEWTPHSLNYDDTTLADLFDGAVTRYSHRPAVYFMGAQLSYAQLDERVRRFAAGLRALGVRRGDRVAIVLPNCPQHVIAFYACQKIGATVIEHNPLYTAHELRGPFEDHGAQVAIFWDKAAPVAQELRQTTNLETIISVNMIEAMPLLKRTMLKLPIPKVAAMRAQLSKFAPNTIAFSSVEGDACGGDGRDVVTDPQISADDVALILYTSGTTGQPKGAQLTHRNLVANCNQGLAWVPNLGDEAERLLGALPFFHAYGLTMVLTLSLLVGGEMVLLPTPRIDLILDLMKKHPPTWLPGVPPLYEKIIEGAEEKGVSLLSVRNAFSGASTLPVSTVKKWEDATHGRLVEGYGLTETAPVALGNPMDGNHRPGYVGLPFPDTEVRIANPDNLDETMPDGEPGEVLLRGPQVFKGYLNNEAETARAFHGDWFRTGDMGVQEPDGFVRLVSRIKEIIITGGFNVYPAEVEEVLTDHPDIEDASVVGLECSDGSEKVVAAITLREGARLDPEGLRDYSRTMLTRYKVPRAFYHYDELPRDQMGKVRRRDIQTLLMETLQEAGTTPDDIH
ncbi:long-chain-fatty-acid--CoA ligase [Corynebacterium ulceribovis]|uniref:long-chain-fatty-acid--CoA ligase n=1 Tax=Corynebacterium ulceribovis TaxID=487732 RepID=UPI00037D4DF1|nr:long-chain-fatty-acid--CoA ligase [Corynebacterium ulceribovis]